MSTSDYESIPPDRIEHVLHVMHQVQLSNTALGGDVAKAVDELKSFRRQVDRLEMRLAAKDMEDADQTGRMTAFDTRLAASELETRERIKREVDRAVEKMASRQWVALAGAGASLSPVLLLLIAVIARSCGVDVSLPK